MQRTFFFVIRRPFRVSKTAVTIEEEVKKEQLNSKTYYELLNVPARANSQQIRAAYLHLAKVIHPDLTGKPSDEFAYITRAYQTLSDPHQRVIYDESLISDTDYYSVTLWKWRLKLKWLLLGSMTLLLTSLALLEPNQGVEDDKCPTTFKLKKAGPNMKTEILSENEKDEVSWKKAARLGQAKSITVKIQPRGIFQKKDNPTVAVVKDDVSSIKLPKDRGFSSG